MTADSVDEPLRRANDDVLGAALTSIDHRLHQISTQLTAMNALRSQLDNIRANLETLIESLGSAGRS